MSTHRGTHTQDQQLMEGTITITCLGTKGGEPDGGFKQKPPAKATA